MIKRWNIDKIVSLTAVVTSLCTMLLLAYEINITRRQQYVAVLPYLQVWNVGMYTPNYKLTLFNDGLGPAFIKSIRVVYKGKAYPGDPTDFLQASRKWRKKVPLKNLIQTTINVGKIIPAGKEFDMIQVNGDSTTSSEIANIFNDTDTHLEIEYASVYDEKWLLSGIGNEPIKE